MALVETVCGRLFVDLIGSGPDLVLWHSLLCDGSMWDPQIAELRDRYRIVNIDAPGHGRSAATTAPYTMDDCVTSAEQVMDTIGVARTSWCGLSWGGMVGMRLALRDPDRLDALVLMDTSARRERPAKKAGYRVLEAIAKRTGAIPLVQRPILPLFFTAATMRDRPELVARFSQRLERMDRTSLVHAVDAVIFERDDVSAEIGRIEAPTLVMVGDQDRATPPAEAELIASQIPGARLVTIPRAAHLANLEQPAFVNAEIGRFLEESARGLDQPRVPSTV